MPLSAYNRLRNLIRVRDVMTPVQVSLPVTWTLREALKYADEVGPGDTGLPYLVRDGEVVVGFVRYWDLLSALEDGPGHEAEDRNRAGVREQMETIRADMIITADTTLWRAADLLMDDWDDQRIWFVFDGNEVTGTFSYRDLFKPLFRVCLFALTVELEQESLRLCMKDAAASWEVLTANRQQKADAAMVSRQRNVKPQHAPERIDTLRRQPASMLEYTTFIDKKTVLIKRNLVPGVDREELEETFDGIEDLRNRCAHPDSGNEPFVGEPKQLLTRIFACHRILAKIREITEPLDPAQRS